MKAGKPDGRWCTPVMPLNPVLAWFLAMFLRLPRPATSLVVWNMSRNTVRREPSLAPMTMMGEIGSLPSNPTAVTTASGASPSGVALVCTPSSAYRCSTCSVSNAATTFAIRGPDLELRPLLLSLNVMSRMSVRVKLVTNWTCSLTSSDGCRRADTSGREGW